MVSRMHVVFFVLYTSAKTISGRNVTSSMSLNLRYFLPRSSVVVVQARMIKISCVY